MCSLWRRNPNHGMNVRYMKGQLKDFLNGVCPEDFRGGCNEKRSKGFPGEAAILNGEEGRRASGWVHIISRVCVLIVNLWRCCSSQNAFPWIRLTSYLGRYPGRSRSVLMWQSSGPLACNDGVVWSLFLASPSWSSAHLQADPNFRERQPKTFCLRMPLPHACHGRRSPCEC